MSASLREYFDGMKLRDFLLRNLGKHDLLIDRAGLHQFFMTADTLDPTILQNDDAICVKDGAHPLSDDQDRAVGGLFEKSFSQSGIGSVIERGKTVVKNVDRGILDQRTGDRQALTLAA
jgi:hypothetical protein